MNSLEGVPLTDLPLTLLSRDSDQGSCLSWVATLVRLHIGLSWTPTIGDGSVILRAGWEPYLLANLGIRKTAANRAKAELLAHGGMRIEGRSVTIPPGPARARQVHRGICRLLHMHMADVGDSPRSDAVATAVLIGLDMYARGRHETDGVFGDLRMDDLESTWNADHHSIAAALDRLRSYGLCTIMKRREGGRGRGSEPFAYELRWPAAWRGLEAAPAAVASSPPSLPTPTREGRSSGQPMTFSMRVGFATLGGSHSPLALQPEGRNSYSQPDVLSAQGRNSPSEDRIPHSQPHAKPCPERKPPVEGRFSPAHEPDSEFAAAPPMPPAASRGNCEPQEMNGDIERGEECGVSTIPPFPPDHQEQQGIPAEVWPRARAILDGATAHGIRLDLTPHLAHCFRDLSPEIVITALRKYRVEDAWDVRAVLYREKLRPDKRDLWHSDIAATIAAGADDLDHVCQTNEDVGVEWAALFARLGLRLSGALAALDHEFPRTRLPAISSLYARHHATSVHTWQLHHATSVHLLTVRPTERVQARPRETAQANQIHQFQVPGEVVPRELWMRILARTFVEGATGAPDEVTTFKAYMAQLGGDTKDRNGIRVWLDTPRHLRLVRQQRRFVLVASSMATYSNVLTRYWPRVQASIRAMFPDHETVLIGPEQLQELGAAGLSPHVAQLSV